MRKHSKVEAEYLLEAIQSAPTCDGLGEVTSLTKRETAVAELTGQGLSNKHIAQKLGISEHTVKNHLFHIFDKLNVANRIELLFLMVKGRDAHFEDWLSRIFSEHGSVAPAMLAAADAGLPAAQLMLGMAHLRGDGVEQDNHAAYHWLRLAAVNSARVVEESRSAIDQLKSCMDSAEIEYLEQKISGQTQVRPAAKLNSGKRELGPALSAFAKAAS